MSAEVVIWPEFNHQALVALEEVISYEQRLFEIGLDSFRERYLGNLRLLRIFSERPQRFRKSHLEHFTNKRDVLALLYWELTGD